MSLLSIIRDRMAQGGGGSPVTETSRVQQMMGAQRGKVVQERGPQATSIRAQMAADVPTGDEQAQLAAAEMGQREAGIQQQTQQALTQQQQARNIVRDDLNNQLDKLLRETNQAERTLDLKRDGAKLEQLAFTTRLTNDKYLHDLHTAGTQRRLDNESNFRVELSRQSVLDSRALFEDDLTFRQLMSADDRDFKRWLGQQDANDLIEQARRRIREDNTKAVIGGLADMAQAYTPSGSPQQYSVEANRPDIPVGSGQMRQL